MGKGRTGCLEFAESAGAVFAVAVEVALVVGKVNRNDKIIGRLVARVRKGVDLSWEPVSICVTIEELADRTVVHAVAEQKQVDRLPDQRDQALQVFLEYLTRRKELTRLD
jgi:hypothetical protein